MPYQSITRDAPAHSQDGPKASIYRPGKAYIPLELMEELGYAFDEDRIDCVIAADLETGTVAFRPASPQERRPRHVIAVLKREKGVTSGYSIALYRAFAELEVLTTFDKDIVIRGRRGIPLKRTDDGWIVIDPALGNPPMPHEQRGGPRPSREKTRDTLKRIKARRVEKKSNDERREFNITAMLNDVDEVAGEEKKSDGEVQHH